MKVLPLTRVLGVALEYGYFGNTSPSPITYHSTYSHPWFAVLIPEEGGSWADGQLAGLAVVCFTTEAVAEATEHLILFSDAQWHHPRSSWYDAADDWVGA